MANIVTMPKLGMTMSKGIIIRWLKKEGEKVEQGDPLLEIQTDKVTMEEESSYSGVLLKILASEGTEVEVNKAIAIIGNEGDDIKDILSNLNGKKPEEEEAEEKILEKISGSEQNNIETEKGESQLIINKPRATPVSRKIAKENNINLENIKGSGPNGRIQKIDVEKYIRNEQKLKFENSTEISNRVEKNLKTIPLKGMRGAIADKMLKSMNTAPHYYITMDIDMNEVLKLRKQLNEKIIQNKLSINSFIVKASSIAIKENPIFNSYVDGENIVLKEEINIGIAVALDEGLIVPVIRNVDKKGFSEIASEEKELIEKAREGSLKPDEYNGGSFTISNLGMYDVTRFTAIINQPEVAILAIGKLRDVPVVINKEIVVKPVMEVTLSSDHRVIDGAVAAKFLRRIKEILEDPIQLML